MVDLKAKLILKTAKRLGYDVNNPKSIVYKTITDTLLTARSFMTKKELRDFLQTEINKLEGE